MRRNTKRLLRAATLSLEAGAPVAPGGARGLTFADAIEATEMIAGIVAGHAGAAAGDHLRASAYAVLGLTPAQVAARRRRLALDAS